MVYNAGTLSLISQPQPEKPKESKAGKEEESSASNAADGAAGERANEHKKLQDALRDATIKFLKVGLAD
eukprot:608024-Pelagomonas_calceolata.AAC.2